jgi:hypothetical protein
MIPKKHLAKISAVDLKQIAEQVNTYAQAHSGKHSHIVGFAFNEYVYSIISCKKTGTKQV